ncbi:zinc finger, CCHC-type containing protein, partial [Tanacetum coccineum]
MAAAAMSVVHVLTTPIPEDGGDDPTVEQAKYMAEDTSSKKFLVSNFTNYKMTYSRPVLEQYNELLGILRRKDFKHTLKHLKEELTLIELGSHLRIEESPRMQDNDKPKGNNVSGPSVVNMVEHNNSSRKYGHLKKDCKGGKAGNKANGSGTNGLVDGSTNSLKGATVHVCKDRCWFKTYESLNDGSILHIGKESTALVIGGGCIDLRLNIVNDNIASAFMSTFKLNDSILWHSRLGHVHFKRMQDMSKDGLIPAFDMDTKKCRNENGNNKLGNSQYAVDLINMHVDYLMRNKHPRWNEMFTAKVVGSIFSDLTQLDLLDSAVRVSLSYGESHWFKSNS